MTTGVQSVSSSQSAILVGGVQSLLLDATGLLQGGDLGIKPVTASIASSALTVGLNPCTLQFRSPTLTNGVPNQRAVTSALSLTIPASATLGSISALQSRILVIAMDATALGGSVELAIVNIAGGNNLDETTLISTTAISAAATSASVIYSTTARTAVPFRVVGYVESTQATAGTWNTAPSTVQGVGGQALSAMSSFGSGQKLTDFTASRAPGTTYYNTTGKAIFVSIFSVVTTAGNYLYLAASGTTIPGSATSTGATGSYVVGVIPPGGSYSAYIPGGGTVTTWVELR